MIRIRHTAGVVLLATVYVAAAKFGIEQPVAHSVITPIWAPSGIAIAALLAFGPRLWPGVAAGAFIANATSDVSIAVALGITVGNTLEAVAATYLLRRVDFSIALERAQDVIAFVGLAAIVSTAISATVGVTTLSIAGVDPNQSFASEWLLWWFGDLVGALLVGPPILVWVHRIRKGGQPKQVFEGVALVAAVAVMSTVVFIGGSWRYPYLVFPLLVWAALRFRQLGAATAVLIVAAIATWGTVHGAVPIGGATATQSVQILQALIAVVAVSVFMIAASLSEKEVAEEALEEAYARERAASARLRELDAMKNTFISAVGHDLRAPLATIAGFAHVLLQKLDDFSEEEVREILERISGNVERMNQMLANLLDLDRLERGDVQASLVQVDLSDLALRVVRSLETDREIHVDKDQVVGWIDEVLMERVLENLLLNAIRHTPPTTSIWVKLQRRDDGVEVSVEDSGPGIPDEQKELVFQAFKRGSDGAAIGTGLGLFLVARFAELHGGRARVEDRAGGGAAFRVFLPQSA